MVRGLILWYLLAFPSFAQTYDLLIRNAHIVDGAGDPWFLGDVGVEGDRIAAVGQLRDVSAKFTVDATGLTLAPGFIDTHSHGLRGIQATPTAENLIRQGVTTIIEGPDGSSPLPIRSFLDGITGHVGVNFGLLVGHGTIRSKVMGSQNRKATPAELDQMKALARQAMLDGAFGLSTGLFYVPGNYASTEEVIELGKVVGRLGGLHTSHMRNEGALVLDSVRETIRIGEDGHLPTQVTHHKIIGKQNWGLSRDTLRLVEEARSRGVDVTVDAYPYTASSTGIGALFPQWSLAGGSKALVERLAAPESHARIKAEIVDRILNDRGAGDPANVVIASCGFDSSLAGKSLADIARAQGRDATPESAAEVAIELQQKGSCSAIYHAISEEDVERILRYPFTMIVSDGGIPAYGKEMPHPRNYGTFARVLGRYVREKKVLTLEDAVHRMSGLPARRFGLQDRGLIGPGMKADLVLFDPALVSDRSDYLHPHQYSVGVDSVWVNGVAAMRQGKMTGALGAAFVRAGGEAMITADQEREFYDRQYRQFLELPDHALRIDRSILVGNCNNPAHPFYERRRLYLASMQALETEPFPGKRVLDYGCGPADFGVWMATESAEVTLLDLSPLAVELGLKRARASGAARRVKGVAADASSLDMFADNAFDLVFACASLHHTLKYPGAMEELARIMRPGARLVLCETWGGNPLLEAARQWRARVEGELEEQGEDIILSSKELKLLEAHFGDIRVQHLNLLAMGKRLLRGKFEKSWARAAVSVLEKTDRAVITICPPLKDWCGEAVITARR